MAEGLILPRERYPDIRVAIDATADGLTMLPDEVIESSLYLHKAERWAIGLDPLWESRTGEEQARLHEAIVLKTAALLSPSVPQARQMNMAGHSATFTYAETPTQRTERLSGLALEEINAYTAVAEIDFIPVFVTTAEGRRA